MGRSITERMYTNPDHSFRDRNAYQITDDEVKDLDPEQELYSIRGDAPEGYYNAGSKKVYVKGGGYKDHQIFKKFAEEEAPEAPVEDLLDTPVEEPKGFTEEKRSYSPEMQRAKERVQTWEASDTGSISKPYGERGLMERLAKTYS